MSEVAKWRVMLRLQIKPTMGPDFEKTWLAVGSSVTNNPCNHGQWLLRDAEEKDIYYIISDWSTREDFEQFERSEAHLGHRQKLHPYRISGSMQTMEIVQFVPSRQSVGKQGDSIAME